MRLQCKVVGVHALPVLTRHDNEDVTLDMRRQSTNQT
jgi:hypothetical protein